MHAFVQGIQMDTRVKMCQLGRRRRLRGVQQKKQNRKGLSQRSNKRVSTLLQDSHLPSNTPTGAGDFQLVSVLPFLNKAEIKCLRFDRVNRLN